MPRCFTASKKLWHSSKFSFHSL